jgi:ribonuclease-3
VTGSLESFCSRLGYLFRDTGLLDNALTHRSRGNRNNERLEFLGDAVLGLCISELLYERFPDVEEGDLSRLRASLVNRETLADIAATLELGELLRLGSGELKSGGFRRRSILADALEAVLGAIYLDGGFDAAGQVIKHLFAERLDKLPPPESLKDAKTRLQEILQGRGHALPEYSVESVSGRDHEQVFHVRCQLPALDLEASGSGGSRRKAEQAAASALLEKLG